MAPRRISEQPPLRRADRTFRPVFPCGAQTAHAPSTTNRPPGIHLPLMCNHDSWTTGRLAVYPDGLHRGARLPRRTERIPQYSIYGASRYSVDVPVRIRELDDGVIVGECWSLDNGGVITFECQRYGGVKSFVELAIDLYGSGLCFRSFCWFPSTVRLGRHHGSRKSVLMPTLPTQTVTGTLFLYYMLQDSDMTSYALLYSSLSLLLNIVVTGIIAGRLLLHRRRIVRQFGPGHGSRYASVAAIVIESGSFYTGFVILVIIFFCVGTAASNMLQQMVAHVEVSHQWYIA